MMKVDQLVRCMTNQIDGVIPMGYNALRVGDKFKVNAVNGQGHIQIVYLDDYCPSAFRKYWYDPSVFRLVPKTCPYKPGERVYMLDYSKVYNGRHIKELVDNETLSLFRPYEVIGYAEGDPDIVKLVTEKGYKFLTGIDTVKRTGIKNDKVPSWF